MLFILPGSKLSAHHAAISGMAWHMTVTIIMTQLQGKLKLSMKVLRSLELRVEN